MKALLIVCSIFISLSAMAKFEITLSKEVYKDVAFSSQFLASGALIRNVNYKIVNKLKPQIEKYLGKELQDRGESHITVITPPEGKGWSYKDAQGINGLISQEELHKKYFNSMQSKKFDVVCVGQRTNDSGNQVFYLVVDSNDLMAIRREIQSELESRAKFANNKPVFDALNYYPHITIGFIGGDVHNVSKGPGTCIQDIDLKIK
jgi:hypothetical protein